MCLIPIAVKSTKRIYRQKVEMIDKGGLSDEKD